MHVVRENGARFVFFKKFATLTKKKHFASYNFNKNFKLTKQKTLHERIGLKWLMNTLGAVVAVSKLLTRLTGTTLNWVKEQRQR